MYIVIFNAGYRDSEILTNMHGFIEEFIEYEDAVESAKECIDGKDYRNFKIFEEDYRKN